MFAVTISKSSKMKIFLLWRKSEKSAQQINWLLVTEYQSYCQIISWLTGDASRSLPMGGASSTVLPTIAFRSFPTISTNFSIRSSFCRLGNINKAFSTSNYRFSAFWLRSKWWPLKSCSYSCSVLLTLLDLTFAFIVYLTLLSVQWHVVWLCWRLLPCMMTRCWT